jgi:hypothetical protein
MGPIEPIVASDRPKTAAELAEISGGDRILIGK